MSKAENFFQQSALYARDRGIREVFIQRIQKEERKISFGKTFIDKYELARNRVSFIRSRAIENSDRLLLDFENLWIKSGGKCLWTVDQEHFEEEIKNLIKQNGLTNIGYNDSPVVQETSIVSILRNDGFKVGKIEQEKIDSFEVTLQMVDWAVVDAGLLVLNEWNQGALRERANAKLNIFLLPVNKFVQQLSDIELLTSFQAIHTQGIAAFPFQSYISASSENWVVFIDNNRTELMDNARLRTALKCIDCNACFEVCPVAQTIGEDAWQSPYKGPIGVLYNSKFYSKEYYSSQVFASTGCGKCQEVCPVGIPLSELVHYSRNLQVESNPSKTEKLIYFFWKSGMEKRSKLEKGGSKLKNFMLRQFFRKSWGQQREMPEVSQKSFNQLWRERKGI